MEAPHTIVIRRAEGGFFSVTLEPPHPDHEPRVFGDIRSARGCASGIRMVTGWPKRDKTEEAAHG